MILTFMMIMDAFVELIRIISLLFLILCLFNKSVIQHIFYSVFGRLIDTQVFSSDYKSQNVMY